MLIWWKIVTEVVMRSLKILFSNLFLENYFWITKYKQHSKVLKIVFFFFFFERGKYVFLNLSIPKQLIFTHDHFYCYEINSFFIKKNIKTRLIHLINSFYDSKIGAIGRVLLNYRLFKKFNLLEYNKFNHLTTYF